MRPQVCACGSKRIDASVCTLVPHGTVALAVKVRDDLEASTVHHEAGLYIVLAVYITPLMVFAAQHALDTLGIRVSV